MKKILLSLLMVCLLSVTTTIAQDSFKSPFGFATDTVSNTGTAYLTIATNQRNDHAVVQVVVTEISGTTGGTITLQGSVDGTNFYDLTDSTSVPELTTKTPLNVASQNFAWVIDNRHPFLRVSYTGTGTMSAYFSAKRVEQ